MSNTNQPIGRLMLHNVRLSFPKLFEPEAFKPGDTPMYSAALLIPKGSDLHAKVEAAAVAALNAKFPGKGAAIRKQIDSNVNKCCIQDGENTSYDGYQGHICVRAKSKTRPTAVDTDRAPLTERDGKLYAGCYVNASIEFFGYDNTGKGLSATLRGVQFVRDGEAFGGGRPADADEFDEVEAEDLI